MITVSGIFTAARKLFSGFWSNKALVVFLFALVIRTAVGYIFMGSIDTINTVRNSE
jgi:hypothetical protein